MATVGIGEGIGALVQLVQSYGTTVPTRGGPLGTSAVT